MKVAFLALAAAVAALVLIVDTESELLFTIDCTISVEEATLLLPVLSVPEVVVLVVIVEIGIKLPISVSCADSVVVVRI